MNSVIERDRGAASSPRGAPQRVIPIQPTTDEVALYEIRKKIQPRAVHGWFARWRLALVTSTIGLSPVTVIVSSRAPTRRSAFTVALNSEASSRPSRLNVLNPVSVKVTE